MKVTAKNNGRSFQTELSNNTNSFTADLPKADGGDSMGFNPKELLCASLATCTAMFLKDFASKHTIHTDGIEVEVSLETNEDESETKLTRVIDLKGNLSDAEKQKMVNSAKHCHLHNILSGTISITSVLK